MNRDALFAAQVIANLLATARGKWRIDASSTAFDFLVVNVTTSERVAIHVWPDSSNELQLRRLKTRLRLLPTVSKLFIVCPNAIPSNSLVPDDVIDIIPLGKLPAALDIDVDGDLGSPKVQADLQARATLGTLKDYRGGAQEAAAQTGKVGDSSDIDRHLISLTRQLPYQAVARLLDHDTVENNLRIGSRVPEVTIVLSDLVNFSRLVSSSSEDVLNAHMQRYYRAARELVFRHGGMLDKFIGDAVLAVFRYPFSDGSTETQVMGYATDLIKLGHQVMESWLGEINASINTGTRVGVANGDIWPLNIGTDSLELSFLGDTINLAARLEKNCAVDGVLIDNRTKTQLGKYQSDCSWTFKQIVLNPGDVKGQTEPINAWQLDPIVK